MSRFCLTIGLSCSSLLLVLFSATDTKAAPAGAPATLAEANMALNLATLPLADGATPPQRRAAASLNYEAPGEVKAIFESQRKQLLGQKWIETPGGLMSDQASSGVFTRDGYTLSLMVWQAGEKGQASVRLTHHGNIDLTKLPLPPGAKSIFAGPASAMFLSTATVDETSQTLKKLLIEKGWQPYGVAGGSLFFKQNGVRLKAFVVAAPAQGGKTMITYSSELMSADLPAPADAIDAQYTDSNTQLLFDTNASLDEIVDYYRQALGKTGWKPTLSQPVKIDFKDTLLFLSPQKDLITLESYQVEGKTRVLLTFATAAEVRELDERLRAAAEKKKLERSSATALPKLTIAIPAEAKQVETAKSRIEFKLGSDKLKPTLAAWRKRFAEDGWKEDFASLDQQAGSIIFKKGEQQVSVNYIDTGFLPAEITISSMGVELERTTEKQ